MQIAELKTSIFSKRAFSQNTNPDHPIQKLKIPAPSAKIWSRSEGYTWEVKL
jgi:hypothetical protein